MIKKILYKPFKYKGKGKFKYSVYVKNTKNNKPKLIHFGHIDYQDYRQHKDKKRKKSYLARAKGIKNKKGQLTWKMKNTKNFWSVHYLWG
tara:strand:+ start:246 stop:515 length:270 start_codon:yes stop_codon:yes gene_type:complete